MILAALLLLNFPLLILADRLATCCIPGFLPLYVFSAWASVILAAWGLARDRARR